MSITAQLNPDDLSARTGTLIDRRQFGAAARLIPAIASLAPDRPLAARLNARLALAQGNMADAAGKLDEALGTWPEDGVLLRLRASIALASDDAARAALAAADAVIADSGDAEAKSLLGRALLKLGHADQARLCLQEAVTANPQDVPAILALAEVLPEQAALLVASAAARMPKVASLHNRLMQILIDRNAPEAACGAAEAAGSASALDVEGHLLAGHAAAMLGEWEKARNLWREVLGLAPRHPSALYRLAAEQARRGDRLDSALIALANDARADVMELAALAGGTILPGRARAAFSTAKINGPVLDLGCGTGLCAIAGRDLPVSAWDGVEASPRLAAIARDRQLYRNLQEGDPVAFLHRETGQWPGISFNFTAGLNGGLSDFFIALASRLAPGGIAVGAFVAAEANRFGPFGCFEHSEGHLRSSAAAACLSLELGEVETLMTVDGLAMRGWIVQLNAP